MQPVIVTPHGQVRFWNGIFAPDQTQQKESLAKLTSVSKTPFPIHFACAVLIDGISIKGDLLGFYHYDRDRNIQVIRS